ncbi:MAG: hypothetical protein FWC51_00515 [Proteobacteria bacterium]|nr:hypothetical protein [Pseudomonadota bacterium]
MSSTPPHPAFATNAKINEILTYIVGPNHPVNITDTKAVTKYINLQLSKETVKVPPVTENRIQKLIIEGQFIQKNENRVKENDQQKKKQFERSTAYGNNQTTLRRRWSDFYQEWIYG